MKLSEMTLGQLRTKRTKIEKLIIQRERERIALPAPVPEIKYKTPNREYVFTDEYDAYNGDHDSETTVKIYRTKGMNEYWFEGSGGYMNCKVKLTGTPHVDIDLSNEEFALDSSDVDDVSDLCSRRFGVGVDPTTFKTGKY